jgi:hypothetical protein
LLPSTEPGLLTRILSYVLDNAVAIATLLGVALSFAVLLEMRRQRRQTYQPHLFLQNQRFWLEKNSNGTPCFMKPLADENKHFYGPPYFLQLENIGAGAAHSIQIAWKYDADRIRNELAKLGTATNRVERDYANHFQYLFGGPGSIGYGFLIDDPPLEGEVLSYLKSGQNYQVRLPETIKNYVTFMPYLKLIERGFPHSIELHTDRFSVEFTYSDISGRRHTERLFAKVEVFAFGKEDHEGNYAVGSVSFGTKRLMKWLLAKRGLEKQALVNAASELRDDIDEETP